MDDDIRKKVEDAIAGGAPVNEALQRGQALQQQRKGGQQAQPQQTGFQRVGGLLKKAGLGIIPQVGEAMYQGGLSLLPGSPTEHGSAEQIARTDRPSLFLNQQQLERASAPKTAAIDTAKNIAGAATYGIPVGKAGLISRLATGGARGAALGASQENATLTSVGATAATFAGGEVLMPLLLGKGKIPLTKKGAAEASTKFAEKGTKQGQSVNWDDLSGQIRDSVKNKFGDTRQIKQFTDTLLGERTPAAIKPMVNQPAGVGSSAGTFEITPKELLSWRRQILARGGSGFLKKFLFGSSLQTKVEGEARNVISSNLHKLVPETITPDKAYSFYSKIGGDLPTWGKRILVEELARRMVLNPLLGGLSGGSRLTSNLSQGIQ